MSEPRTVLFVQHYPDGGSVTSLLDLVRGLDPERYRPLVSFRNPNPFVEEFRAAGAEVVFLYDEPAPLVDPSPGIGRRAGDVRRSTSLRREVRRLVRRDLPTARRLLAVVRRHHVDLVHANNDVRVNRDAVLVALLVGLPTVVHVRWIYPAGFDVAVWIDRQLARRVARFLFISAAAAAAYGELRIGPGRTTVLDNPFDVEDYRSPAEPSVVADLGLPADAQVVLHIGRLTRWKGQDVLIRSLAELRPTHARAHVVLVGAATDQRGRTYEAELRALVVELDLADRVHFAGARRDIAAVLAVADVVVHCSTEPEPFGRVVVEAMAAGRPVVGADGGGVPEILEDGVTGLLVAPSDVAALAAAVGRVLDDPQAAAAMGARAGAEAASRFGLAAHARSVQVAYDEVLAGSGGRRRLRRRRG